MIVKNGITYVKRGSSEDNGSSNHYYYSKNVTETHNIILNGLRGTITINRTVYLDSDTDLVIDKDYFSWRLKVGSRLSTGVCTSLAEEQQVLDIINNSGVPDDGDSPLDNGNDNGSNGSGNGGSGSGSETGDENGDGTGLRNGLTGNGDNNNEDNGNNGNDGSKGIFNDSMGSSNNKNSYRDSLPLGANINNPDVLGIDYTLLLGPIPKDTNLANKGTTYPIIRINDHYFHDSEIIYFSMETGYYKDYTEYQVYQMPVAGFIPTMKLIVNSSNQGLLKRNHVKQGDKCAVFFQSNHKMVKSMRCDFRITNVVTNQMDLNKVNRYTTQIITGELYVPDLRNEEIRYNFNGSSRDALMDAAKRLRLSFFFCDPDDTDDIMVWCNCKTPEMFIKDITTHAWKNANAFYESWIDPRYGLAFMNINRLLGEDGLDEPLDATLWINTFINNRAADGNATEESPELKVANDKPLAKIMTNIPGDDESATVYHVNKWRLINNAQEIQDFIGLNCKMQYESVNPGLTGSGASNYSVEFSLCLNRTKFDPNKTDNDFYVLLGPARNMTYASGDSAMGVSETLSSNKAEPEKVVNQQSDGDAAAILATDGNMLSSGNTHRFYEVAYEHNMRNLLLLQKQYIEVELNGANLTIVRGEKMPIMLMDLNKADLAIRTSLAKTLIEELIFEAESGWYIIDGIEWVFDPENGTNTGTCWRTNVKLVRREWPVPGKDNRVDGNTLSPTSKQLVLVNIGNNQMVKMAYADALAEYPGAEIMGAALDEVVVYGKSKKTGNTVAGDGSEETIGKLYTGNGVETVSSINFNLDLIDQYVTKADVVELSTIPLTGLKSFMKEIYRQIEEASDKKCKLVSARRWAVDEYGNKVDGNAFVKKYDYYKCMNAIGEVMYFKKNNSRHLYGEAIDIINNGMEFTELMTNIIMKNSGILRLFYDYGVSAYIELAKDDTGALTKHYHIGTDTIKQKEFWASVKAILGSDKIPGTGITFTNYMKNNINSETEVTKADVDENSLKTDEKW